MASNRCISKDDLQRVQCVHVPDPSNFVCSSSQLAVSLGYCLGFIQIALAKVGSAPFKWQRLHRMTTT